MIRFIKSFWNKQLRIEIHDGYSSFLSLLLNKYIFLWLLLGMFVAFVIGYIS